MYDYELPNSKNNKYFFPIFWTVCQTDYNYINLIMWKIYGLKFVVYVWLCSPVTGWICLPWLWLIMFTFEWLCLPCFFFTYTEISLAFRKTLSWNSSSNVVLSPNGSQCVVGDGDGGWGGLPWPRVSLALSPPCSCLLPCPRLPRNQLVPEIGRLGSM